MDRYLSVLSRMDIFLPFLLFLYIRHAQSESGVPLNPQQLVKDPLMRDAGRLAYSNPDAASPEDFVLMKKLTQCRLLQEKNIRPSLRNLPKSQFQQLLDDADDAPSAQIQALLDDCLFRLNRTGSTTTTTNTTAQAFAQKRMKRDLGYQITLPDNFTYQVMKWDPQLPILYHFDHEGTNFSDTAKDSIRDALMSVDARTCLNFQEAAYFSGDSPKYNGIRFINEGSCISFIGRILPYSPLQITWLEEATGCTERRGLILHHILHNLGFIHEHIRTDRNEFVSINWTNIKEKKFNTYYEAITPTLFGPYDFESVLHWRKIGFHAINERVNTINAQPGFEHLEDTMGQEVDLSFIDLKALNAFYCSGVCPSGELFDKCNNNGGFPNPADCNKCLCPDIYDPSTNCVDFKRHSTGLCSSPQFIDLPPDPDAMATISLTALPDSRTICVWTIRAPEGFTIRTNTELSFMRFFISREYNGTFLGSCYTGWVEIRSLSSPNQLARRFCTTAVPDVWDDEGFLVIFIYSDVMGYGPIDGRFSLVFELEDNRKGSREETIIIIFVNVIFGLLFFICLIFLCYCCVFHPKRHSKIGLSHVSVIASHGVVGQQPQPWFPGAVRGVKYSSRKLGLFEQYGWRS